MLQSPWIKTVLLLLCVLVFTCPSKSQATTAPHKEKLLEEAKSFFKIGYVFQKQGLEDMALLAFKKSRALLLQAGEIPENPKKDALHHTMQAYYRKLALTETVLNSGSLIRPRSGSISFSSSLHEKHVRTHMQRLLTKGKGYLQTSFTKSQKYMPMIRKEFAIQGIPLELAYLAIIESGFNTQALSHAGARGIWQFIPSTAKLYGLEVSSSRDDRTDPFKSTRAAAMYLKKLYKQFGDWPLALAAYNCGEYRVAQALKKHNAKTFWDLLYYDALPKETQVYVPSIIAVTIISRDLDRYGITTQ